MRALLAAYRRWGISPRPEDSFNINDAANRVCRQRARPCTAIVLAWRQAVAVQDGDRHGGDRRGSRMIAMRHAAVAHRRMSRLDPVVRGLLWSGSAGLLFVVLNTMM